MTLPAAIRVACVTTFLGLGFFAGWTLGSVPLTLLCAPFQFLWGAFGLGLLGAGLAVSILRKPLEAVLLTPARSPTGPAHVTGWTNVLLFGAGTVAMFGAVVLFIPTANALALWLVTIMLGCAALTLRGQTLDIPKPGLPAKGNLTWFPTLLLVLLILTLYVVILRPDADDSFYLNLPIGLIASQTCMMGVDTMYGAENWPILGSNYRVEALPTLVAALSAVTTLPVITVAHLVIPAIWCLVWASTLIVIGHGLFGKYWWSFALLAVLASMTFAGTLQTWGVHGIGRMFHGKAPLILIVFPLLVFLTLRAEAARTSFGVTFAAIFGLCVVALGLTANAIYLAPLVLLIALVSARIAFPGASFARLMLIAASAPPVLAGLWLFLIDRPVSANLDSDWSVSTTLAVWMIASDKLMVLVLGLVLGLAALAARFGPMGRGVTAYTVLFFLVAINPILWPFYDRFVTGGLTFRMWWALPLPMFLAAVLTWGILRVGRVWLGTAVFAVVLLGMAQMPSGLLGMTNTTLKPSIHKVPPEVMLVVQEVLERTPPEATVLAPEAVSSWLSTWEGHPALVYTRQLYFGHNAQAVEPTRLAPRKLLAEWINGEGDHAANAILNALAQLETRLIVIPASGSLSSVNNILENLQKELVGSLASYELYQISP